MFQPSFEEELGSFRPRWFQRPVVILALFAAFIAFLVVILFTAPDQKRSVTSAPARPRGPALAEYVIPAFASDRARSVVGQAVYLTARVSGGGLVLGSGFLVGSALVVTAAHVVAGCDDLEVNCAGRTVKGRVTSADQDSDVAVVSAGGCAAAPAEFGTAPVSDRLLILAAHRYDWRAGRTRLEVSSVAADPDARGISLTRAAASEDDERIGRIVRSGTRLFALTAESPRGNSGAPVIDADGRIVGMAIIDDPSDGRTYAVAASEILAVLNRYGVSVG